MKLHLFKDEFRELTQLVAADKNIPETAVELDYNIVFLLNNLANSEYADLCVFKGGTSLSKCYPGSIERFSEDIDLTFLGMEKSDSYCDKTIKKIEKAITKGANTEKIIEERSNRSKSMKVWFDDINKFTKLEIGSSVRPDPYSEKTLKSYIHEYLENNGFISEIERYELSDVTLNVLNIERTFVDKLMSVKRHSICGTIGNKVRHIYDVIRLFMMPEIKDFMSDKQELKRLMRITKETDGYYLEKRGLSNQDYNADAPYEFATWKEKCFTGDVCNIYGKLHENLLYTSEKQDYNKAIDAFEQIDALLKEIEE